MARPPLDDELITTNPRRGGMVGGRPAEPTEKGPPLRGPAKLRLKLEPWMVIAALVLVALLVAMLVAMSGPNLQAGK